MELTIDTYFDKVFYINLELDVERREHMERQFAEFGIENYERVHAVSISELPAKELYRNFIKSDERYIKGSLGCRASHVACVALARERGYKRVMILEDDVLFLHDPNMLLAQNAAMLNDWDMLYFGGLVEPFFRNQVVCAHAYGVRNTLYGDILCMAESSGMEIDNFYAKIIQHMSYNYNRSGKYNIRLIAPFNQVVQQANFVSNIQNR